VSWFKRRRNKPNGIYNASSREYACVSCAYYEKGTCHLHNRAVENAHKKKCGDFLRADHSIPEFKEATQ